jgi:hypothetical protein
MKLNVLSELKNFDGSSIFNTKADGTVFPVTIKDVVVNVIAAPQDKDDGMARMKKFDLAMKLFKGEGEVEITPEEATLIKDGLGKSPFGPVVVGPILHLLGY